jgi:hypothetical protein
MRGRKGTKNDSIPLGLSNGGEMETFWREKSKLELDIHIEKNKP